MLRNVLLGSAAGAVGTLTLDVVTYLDMLRSGRPASEAPAKVAGVLAQKAGVDFAGGGASDEQAQSRQSATGALLGYATGVGIGAIYGVLRPHIRSVPRPVVGIVLGLAAMAASDIPIAATGVSDPKTWSAANWTADLVPHLAYGLLTAIAYDAFAGT